MFWRVVWKSIGMWGLLLFCTGLRPEQIALIVNSNVPEGVQLAEHYAQARGIPDGRIIPLILPRGDEIEFDEYERYVVPYLREWLSQRQLNGQVRCLVTFYGVPLRIRDRTNTAEEKLELADLHDKLAENIETARPLVEQMERLARAADPSFQAPARTKEMTPMQDLEARYARAVAAAGRSLAAATQPSTRMAGVREMIGLMAQLGGKGDLADHFIPANIGAVPQDVRDELTAQRDMVLKEIVELTQHQLRRFDAAERAAVLDLARKHFGLIHLGGLLESQIDYLTPGKTNAALDSELSLLWLNYYPRNGPWLNPMYYRAFSPYRGQALLVSRLDAPTAAEVERIIDTSVDVEKTGLKGSMVINSFGYLRGVGPDGVGPREEFNRQFHDLEDFVTAHSRIPVRAEYERFLSNHEAKNTALYTGWYSLRNYIPGMSFSPGAVGYHIASLEMVSLHGAGEGGWAHGLLSDGITATMGAVAEPYLAAFPEPDEFFPLLMTGRLTLAETYWRTQMTTSWMMCLVGDPLYTPYRVNPAMKVEDLPPALRRAAMQGVAATRAGLLPATRN